MIDFLIQYGAGIVSLLVVLLIIGGLVVTFGAPHKTGDICILRRNRPGWLYETGRLKITRSNPNAVGGVSVSYYSGRRDVVNWNSADIIDIQDAE